MIGGKIMPKTKGSKNRNLTKLELEFLECAKKNATTLSYVAW